jgi:putative transposase
MRSDAGTHGIVVDGLAGRGRRPSRRTIIPDLATQTPGLVKRDFRPAAPDRLWLADIPYIWTDEAGHTSPPSSMPSAPRGRRAPCRLTPNELAAAALHIAIGARHPAAALINHTARGCQYTAIDYAALLAGHGIARSLGRAPAGTTPSPGHF